MNNLEHCWRIWDATGFMALINDRKSFGRLLANHPTNHSAEHSDKHWANHSVFHCFLWFSKRCAFQWFLIDFPFGIFSKDSSSIRNGFTGITFNMPLAKRLSRERRAPRKQWNEFISFQCFQCTHRYNGTKEFIAIASTHRVTPLRSARKRYFDKQNFLNSPARDHG